MLEFKSDTHEYFYDGKKIPSVTTILSVINKPALIPWAVRCAADHIKASLFAGDVMTDERIAQVAQEAKDAYRKFSTKQAWRGTQVHSHAENYVRAILNGGYYSVVPEDEQVKRGYEAFKAWFTSREVEPLEVEKKVVSKVGWYAGTVDLICKIGGDLCIVDYKTSTGIYPEYYLQLVAYQEAYEEEMGTLVDKRIIVRFDKYNGSIDVEYREVDSLDRDLEAFQAAAVLYKWLGENK